MKKFRAIFSFDDDDLEAMGLDYEVMPQLVIEAESESKQEFWKSAVAFENYHSLDLLNFKAVSLLDESPADFFGWPENPRELLTIKRSA